MSGLASYELQSAIFDALNNNVALMAKINAVWDEPDAAAPYPYITVGDGTVRDKSTKTETGAEHVFLVEVWSTDGGRMEMKDIMGSVHDVLHDTSLTLSGNALVFIRFENAEDKREVDETQTLYHGLMKFKAFTMKS